MSSSHIRAAWCRRTSRLKYRCSILQTPFTPARSAQHRRVRTVSSGVSHVEFSLLLVRCCIDDPVFDGTAAVVGRFASAFVAPRFDVCACSAAVEDPCGAVFGLLSAVIVCWYLPLGGCVDGTGC